MNLQAPILILLAATLPSVVHAADCPAPTTSAQLSLELETAEQAFADRDKAGTLAARDAAAAALPCLADELNRHIAARYHRVYGLGLFLEGDAEQAQLVFAAARSAEPAYKLPEWLIPAGHPLHSHYEAIDLISMEQQELLPPEGRLLMDGRDARFYAPSLPTIVQLIDADGAVTSTTWLAPSGSLPDYPAKPEPVAETEVSAETEPNPIAEAEPEPDPSAEAVPDPVAEAEPDPIAEPEPASSPLDLQPPTQPPSIADAPPPSPARLSLLVGAGASAVVAGTCYGLASIKQKNFQAMDPARGDTEADALAHYNANRALFWSSVGTGALAAGLVTGAVLEVHW